MRFLSYTLMNSHRVSNIKHATFVELFQFRKLAGLRILWYHAVSFNLSVKHSFFSKPCHKANCFCRFLWWATVEFIVGISLGALKIQARTAKRLRF
jgi:hypothetical protein